VRPLDEPIPNDESLYMRLAPGELDGPRPLPTAIQVNGGLSVARHKYLSNPPFGALLPQHRPLECCVAASRGSSLPLGPHQDGVGTKFILVLADDPRPPENDLPALPAHAEVRLLRDGAAYDPDERIPRGLRKDLQSLLADRFRACYLPSTFPGGCPDPTHSDWTTAGPGCTLAAVA
jgi:hypothetical protein